MRIPSTAGMRHPERSRFFHKLSGDGGQQVLIVILALAAVLE
jgi:hypothetical protein